MVTSVVVGAMSNRLELLLDLIPLLLVVGAGVAWLYARRTDWITSRREERKEDRAVLTDEFTRLRQANEDLTSQLGQFAPHLAQLRKEYAEAIQREIFLLDQLKDLTAQNAVAAHERYRLKVAITELSEHVEELRGMLGDAGIDLPPAPDLSAISFILDEVQGASSARPALEPGTTAEAASLHPEG